MLLWDMMMMIHHPSNPKFALFHSVDKSWREVCYILTILKLAESYAHAMISALLPFLQWKFTKERGDQVASLIAKWFTPTAWVWVADAYWDPWDKCIKNTSNKMLELVTADDDDLYWEAKVTLQPVKWKRTQIDKESLNDSVLTVKTAVTQKKTAAKSILKAQTQMATTTGTNTQGGTTDANMVMSQTSVISHLMEQVSQIKIENRQMMECFDQLAAQMEAFLNNQTTTSPRCQARGHSSESQQT